MKKNLRTVNMHEAKTQLSKLVDQASKGDPFIIAKAGKPMVKVVAVDTPSPGRVQRLGFMVGQIKTPDDFNTMGGAAIQRMFEGEE
jgi:prevent-host-death family protein